jgi:hypothetical protein
MDVNRHDQYHSIVSYCRISAFNIPTSIRTFSQMRSGWWFGMKPMASNMMRPSVSPSGKSSISGSRRTFRYISIRSGGWPRS